MKNKLISPLFNTHDKYNDLEEKSCYKPVIDENEQENSCKTKKKFIEFLAPYYHYFLAAGFILIFFFIMLIAYRVYPFGNNDISSYDMISQIVPFIEHIFDVFSGKSSLLYSTAIAGGADVFGTLAYCLISPFTWIFLLFGKSNVYYGTAIVLPLKLIAISFSALYFLGKAFPKIPKPVRALYALLYAYSGWTFVANTYINWMDFAIYLPFVALGFKKLITYGKIIDFAIPYALMIYTCFSLACFSMLLTFLIAVGYVFLTRKDEKEKLNRASLAFLLAVSISLPVMVPSFLAYLSSERSTSIFDNLYKDLDVTHLYRKTSYIVSDAFFVFLTIVYFVKHGVKRPIDGFLLFAGVILLAPVFIDECCNLLNGGAYLSYSLRFGFLNSFYWFYVSEKLTEEFFIEDKIKNAKDKIKLKKTLIFGSVLVLSVALSIVYICLHEKIIAFIDGIYKIYDENSSYSFFAIFAHSLGGLELLGPLALLICVSLILAVTFYMKKSCDKRVIAVALSCLLISQLAFYNLCLVKGNLHDPAIYEDYNEIVRLIGENEENENDYYRIKDTTDQLTADAPLTTHTNSFSVFSSVVDSKNFTAIDFFNYSGNGINSGKSARGHFLGDMLLGYKYYFHKDKSDEKDYSALVKRSYITKLDYTSRGSFSAYENQAVFPNAFTVKSGDLNFDGLNYAEKLNKLHYFLGGKVDFCDEYTLDLDDVKESDDGTFKVYIQIATKESYWFLTTDFPEKFDITYTRSSSYDVGNAKKLNCGDDILFDYYEYSKARYTATLKDAKGLLTKDDIIKYCTVYGTQVKTVYDQTDGDEEVYDVVWKNKVDYEIVNGNQFNIAVDAADDETYLFLNYVKLDGHVATVNGKKAELIDNGLDLMLFKLEKGQNEVVIKYRSPYIKYAVFGLIAGLFIIALIYCLLKIKKFYKVFDTVIYVCGIVLFIAVAGFFILLPVSAFLVKAVKLLVGLFI